MTILSEKLKADIDRWATRFPPEQRQSALLKALLLAQDAHENWLSNEVIEAVADYVGVPHVTAYEVATFYSMYNLKPLGKYRVDICTNISCMLSGSSKIVDHFQQRLGISFGETTPDGKFTLKEVECLAECAAAPVCQIGRDFHTKLTPEKVDHLLEQVEKKLHGK